MDRALAIEIATAAKALNVALGEVQAMVDRRKGGAEMKELLRHARELMDILRDAVKHLGDVPEAPAALGLAAKLAAELEGRNARAAGRLDKDNR